MHPVRPTDLSEEQLGRLLALMPPVPPGWVAAAQELPAGRRALDALHERILEGAEERAVLTADLEAALRRAGHEPTPALTSVVRTLVDRDEPR